MSGRSFLWQGVLWIERFLPTPVSMVEDGLASAARRRKAMLVLLIFPVILLLRERHEIFGLILQSRVAFGQLLLLVAGCVGLAAIAFGMKAWHDARSVR